MKTATRHPFSWLSPASQKAAFFIFFVLTFVTMIALRFVDRRLQTAAAPDGIISFELAGSLPAAEAIIIAWGETGRMLAAVSLGLDFLFIFLYATTIGLGCILVIRGLSRAVQRLGLLLAWGQVAAGLLDIVENVALIRLLLGSRESLWPQLARAAALPKFLLVGLGIVFVVGVTIVTMIFSGRTRR